MVGCGCGPGDPGLFRLSDNSRFIHKAEYFDSKGFQIGLANSRPDHFRVGDDILTLPDCTDTGPDGLRMKSDRPDIVKVGSGVYHSSHDGPLVVRKTVITRLVVYDLEASLFNLVRFHRYDQSHLDLSSRGEQSSRQARGYCRNEDVRNYPRYCSRQSLLNICSSLCDLQCCKQVSHPSALQSFRSNGIRAHGLPVLCFLKDRAQTA